MIVPRKKYLLDLMQSDGRNTVKVITGVRRCGKTFLLFNLFKDSILRTGFPKNHIIELAFDNYSSQELRNPDNFFNWLKTKILDYKKHYLFLDEVQLLDSFEQVLIEVMRMANVEVYVTGSNAKLLSKDIITEFRGRGEQIRIYPLSFSEFYEAYSGDKKYALDEYLVYGGMPEVVNLSIEQKDKYLNNLFSEIYINDIVERNSIRDKGMLEEILDTISSGIGSLTNPKKIADTFTSNGNKTNSVTVRNYIEYLKDAFIVEEAKRYNTKGRRYIGSPYKFYFCDLGLRNARMNFRQTEVTHAMENALYNELRYRGYGVDVGIVPSSIKNDRGMSQHVNYEIDFVANKGNERVYVQSAYEILSSNKLKTETRSLLKLDDSFKKIIVTRLPVVPRYDEYGILHIGIEDFLLTDKWSA